MSKLELHDKKTLKLVNVLSKKVSSGEFFVQEKHIAMLYNWIKAKGLRVVGPLVLYSGRVKGFESGGKPMVEHRISIQLSQDNVNIEYPYKFEKQVRVDNCLYIRFNDKAENVRFATMELQVYAYKKDIELTGEVYSVIVKDKDDVAIIDLFMPIKVLKSEES